ncbi:12070_t:CDS:2 [Funneliformis geosporum]|uniref:18467_t:CDS:1 n=1 Tax=Funneliformis geosporum TaxID=1117311 RepID=A0A9W4WQN6_9GLOM|nr:12070_t:CDS:2 [Funneliformis geosporum]CAI2164886.1 18467_t:CDS:2 [Funneliformis geosporum]
MGEKNKQKTVHESRKEGAKYESVNGPISELDQFIDERIILNVGGIKYETYRSTLTAYPKTLLGTMFHPRNRAMLHPTNGNEYFIDRNGYIFHYVMEYYRTGNIVWRPSFELPIGNSASLKSSNSSTTTVSSTSSTSNNNNTSISTHTDLNNATVPTGAALAALSLTTNGILSSTSNGVNGSNNGIISKGVIINNNLTNNSTPPISPTTSDKPTTSNNHYHVLHHHRHCCSHSNSKSAPPIFPPYVSLPELEQEFSYFGIPFTSPLTIAQETGGALLDEFAYSIEDLLCTAIAKLIDRISITFFRDGSLLECILIKPPQVCSNCSAAGAHNCPGRCSNHGGNGAKLIEFSLNGYCIVNHFYEDIKKYLEKVFPNMIFKLEFGNNYKSITMSMSSLFTRNAIQKYSKIVKTDGDSNENNNSNNNL